MAQFYEMEGCVWLETLPPLRVVIVSDDSHQAMFSI